MPKNSVLETCTLLANREDILTATASGKTYMFLLPLLEHQFVDVNRELRPALQTAGVCPAYVDLIRLDKLVEFALLSWGDYWPELGISWLEQGMQRSAEMEDVLRQACQNRFLTQKLRHRAIALLKSGQS
jgi:hypothetical protein